VDPTSSWKPTILEIIHLRQEIEGMTHENARTCKVRSPSLPVVRYNHNNEHAYAGQLNGFTHLRALLVLNDRGFMYRVNACPFTYV
jgi:hypothetical protein